MCHCNRSPSPPAVPNENIGTMKDGSSSSRRRVYVSGILNVNLFGTYIAKCFDLKCFFTISIGGNMTLDKISFFLFCLVFTSISAPLCKADLDSGDINYKIFDDKKAYAFYSKALSNCPDYESLMKTTRALIDIGEDVEGKEDEDYFASALTFTDSMQKKFPDSIQSYFLKAAAAGNLAIHKSGKAKIELARTIESNAKKAISIDSSYAPAHVILGVYYRQVATINMFSKTIAKAVYGKIPEGTLKDSEQELTKALSYDNDNIFAHYELAQTLYSMDRKKEAKEQLLTVLTLPNNNNQAAQIKKSAEQLLKKW
jgi:tetratricopeptide (TPR) repeat protein